MELLEWLSFEQVVYDELVQARQEGKDVAPLGEELDRIRKQPGPDNATALRNIYQRILDAKDRSGYPYVEPIGLAEIHAERRPSQVTTIQETAFSRENLFDKVYGAWLGRCSGCLLGKPVEGMTAEQINALLAWKEAWPLNFYIAQKGGLPPGFLMDEEQKKRYLTGTFENVTQMLRDDDIDYSLIALSILEKYGPDFSGEDVGATWLQTMPLLMTYTAERVAYRNFANGLKPPETGLAFNPYREWIGAQIRGDVWGYVNPGNPERAAVFAYRDATLSHRKNGVYGEMLIAAMIAAAFGAKNIREIIAAGLDQIPERSRLMETAIRVMEWQERDHDWRITLGRILNCFADYNWFHTIPNAAIVIMALLYGEGDFEKSTTIAVMAGLDTDCNGATVGSIIGAYLGSAKLPAKWIDPLNDRVATAVVGMSDTSIRDLAARTIAFV